MATKSKVSSAFMSSFSTLGHTIASLSVRALRVPSSSYAAGMCFMRGDALWDDVAYAKRGYRSIL